MSDRVVIKTRQKIFHGISAGLFALLLATGGGPALAQPAGDDCNCDIKEVLKRIQQARSRGEMLDRKHAALTEELSAIHQEMMRDVLQATARQGAGSILAEKAAWSAFSLLGDLTLDYADFVLAANKQQLVGSIRVLDKEYDVDLLGPMHRLGRNLAKKAGKKVLPKGAKVAKSLNGMAGSTGGGAAAPELRRAATLFDKLEEIRKQIAQVRSAEDEGWRKLLGEDCRRVLEDLSPKGSAGPLGTFDLNAAVEKVSIPWAHKQQLTDRQIASQFYKKGFLRTEHERIRQVLKRKREIKHQVYRYRVVANRLIKDLELGAGDCDVCTKIESLRALTLLKRRLTLLQIEWHQTHMSLLRNVTARQHDITRLLSEDTRGGPSQAIAGTTYQLATLALSLPRAVSGYGTLLSAIEAFSAVNSALTDYIVKAPVAAEIRADARFTNLFAEGLAVALQDLDAVYARVEKNTGQHIAQLLTDERIKACPVAVTRISARQEGELVFEHLQYKEDPRVSKPIGKGVLTLEIAFNRDMDFSADTTVRIAKLGQVQGGWAQPRIWRGRVQVPGGEALAKLQGWRGVFVEAQARSWDTLEVGADTWGPDLHQDAELYFGARRPQVKGVAISKDGKPVYLSPAGLSKPLQPGSYEISVEFDRRMLTLVPAEVKLLEKQVEKTMQSLKDLPGGKAGAEVAIEGDWANDREWRGRLEIPKGEIFEKLKDEAVVSIQAASAEGRTIDSDPSKPGEQPDTRHVVPIGPRTLISGQVKSTTGEPVSVATVRIEIDDEVYEAKSGAAGGYTVALPLSVPDLLIVTAQKKNFDTASRTIRQAEFQEADLTLEPARGNVIQIDSGLHHLGDSSYDGRANSRFQKRVAEGARYNTTFRLEPKLAPPYVNRATLRMLVRGAEISNPILLNGKRIGTLEQSSGDGSARKMSLAFDAKILKAGSNSLVIRAETNKRGQVDDLEFANIQLEIVLAIDSLVEDIVAAWQQCQAVKDYAKFGGATFRKKRRKAEAAYRAAWKPLAVYVNEAGGELPESVKGMPAGRDISCPPP